MVGAPDPGPAMFLAGPDPPTPWMGTDAAVADPSRHGYLSTGQRYFKKAAAAARYIYVQKQTKHRSAEAFRTHRLRKASALLRSLEAALPPLLRGRIAEKVRLPG